MPTVNNILLTATITNKLQSRVVSEKNVIDVICNFTSIGSENTSSIKVTGWGKTADTLIELAIGDQIFIEGRTEMNKVDREDGTKITIAKITANRVTKLPIGSHLQVNTVNLVGRTGQDPEIKWFEGSGKSLCSTTLAVGRRSKNKETDWFSLKVWGKVGEILNQYASKGSQIGITGALEVETWIDKTTNQPRTRPIVKVNDLDLLGSKKDNQEAPGYSTASNGYTKQQPVDQFEEDKIPF